MKYVDVILPLPLEGLFTYAVNDSMVAQVKMGVRLLVPLGACGSHWKRQW
jgi:primosomal protein N' (replication factor Y)